jgi:hypothetical protein
LTIAPHRTVPPEIAVAILYSRWLAKWKYDGAPTATDDRRHSAQPARADRRIRAHDAVRRRLSGLCGGAIFTITSFTGVTGDADFSNKSRAPDKEVTIMAVKDGKFVPIGNRKPSPE